MCSEIMKIDEKKSNKSNKNIENMFRFSVMYSVIMKVIDRA